jgi:four helix bundle protein
MNHKELDVWKKSMDLVVLIYGVTQSFLSEEKFGLTSQLRRAVVSIPSNIAEGMARKGDAELIHFLHIALGSLAELETQYEIAIRVNFTMNDESVFLSMIEVRKLLLGFRNYLKDKK